MRLPLIKIKCKWHRREKFNITWKKFKVDVEKHIFFNDAYSNEHHKISWKLRYQIAFMFWVYKKIVGEWYEE